MDHFQSRVNGKRVCERGRELRVGGGSDVM